MTTFDNVLFNYFEPMCTVCSSYLSETQTRSRGPQQIAYLLNIRPAIFLRFRNVFSNWQQNSCSSSSGTTYVRKRVGQKT